jgi:hypothetical protein
LRSITVALQPSTTPVVFDFITGDFADAWNALAMVPTDAQAPWRLTHRGNYLFGMQAMVLLEWICRLCKSDATGQALQDFSDALNNLEPRYFTQIPSPCRIPGCPPGGFHLPSVGGVARNLLLLSMLFDLLRNGLAHRYEQIIVPLTAGDLGISLFGVEPGHWLQTVLAFRASHHLSFRLLGPDIIVSAHPGILFLDFKAAFENAHLAEAARGLTPDPFVRGGAAAQEYQFSAQQLQAALQGAGHLITPQ